MQNQAIIVTGSFPANASELPLQKYITIGAFGNAEAEEAAVRLLMFSKEQANFVAVSWPDIAQVWVDEFKEYHSINQAKNANWDSEAAFSKAMKTYRTKVALTLGVGYFFFKKPTQPKAIEVEEKLTKNLFAPTLMFGAGNPQALANGFWKLIEKGLVEKKEQNGLDYFYPTPALVSAFC